MKTATKKNKGLPLSLSPLEQKIYFPAKESKDGIIFLDVIKSWKLCDDKTLLFSLHKMCKKGWLIKIKRGIYLVSEPGLNAIPDPFVASTYFFNGYNAFFTALYIYKLTDQIPFEIYVATGNQSSYKKYGQVSFRAIPIGRRAIGSINYQGYVVSSLPKTIYDCLTHPSLAGGYLHLLRAIYDAKMKEEQWKEVLWYAGKFNERNAFYQRLGYLLSLLPKKNSAIQRIISFCGKKVKSNAYLENRKIHGRYISKWKLIDNVGKETLLSWWYHG